MAKGPIPKLGRVTDRYKADGKWCVVVEWIDDEGYRVKAGFVLSSWHAPPRAVGEETMKILNSPPIVTYCRGRRARAQ